MRDIVYWHANLFGQSRQPSLCGFKLLFLSLLQILHHHVVVDEGQLALANSLLAATLHDKPIVLGPSDQLVHVNLDITNIAGVIDDVQITVSRY